MTTEIISFPRNFQMWQYTVGHGQLLLRSVKASGLPTRIDVLFKNVSAIHLHTLFNGLAISEATESEKSKIHSHLGSPKVEGRKIFIVRTSEFIGYVVAGVVAWHEDDGEYYEPSHFPLAPYPNLES